MEIIKKGFYPTILYQKFLSTNKLEPISYTNLGVFEEPKPTEPVYIKPPGDSLVGISIILLWFCIPFGIMTTINLEDKSGGLLLLVISLFAFLFLKIHGDWKKSADEKYRKAKEKYYDKLSKWKNFQVALKEVDSINNNENTLKVFYRIQRNKSLKKIIQHSHYVSKKGISELAFLTSIEQVIKKGDHVLSGRNKIILIKDAAIIPEFYYTKSTDYRPYQPDILLKCEETGLYFDIEIDEPYTYEEKTPIHFFDEVNNSYVDENRDRRIVGSNWIVIRFCEEQINKYPEECITYIFITVSFFNESNYLLTFEDFLDLLAKKGPPSIKRWTKSEALVLAENSYREQYLSLPIDNVEHSHFVPKKFIEKDDKNQPYDQAIQSQNTEVIHIAILKAIENDLLIQFSYQKSSIFSDGSSSRRTIKPYHFEKIGTTESLCIRGYCYLREEEKVFSIERMTDIIINPFIL